MIFYLNDKQIDYQDSGEVSLLKFLRNEVGIMSVKDGCSGQSACGACLVEVNGKGKLSCVTKMRTLEEARVYTLEGIPAHIKSLIGKSFADMGAVQCGYCTPGFIMRTRLLLEQLPNPSLEEIRNALKPHLCRCTGYKKIEEAIEESAARLMSVDTGKGAGSNAQVGASYLKYESYETAIGKRLFAGDLKEDAMLYAALKFSDHPRAKVLKIDCAVAEAIPGVVKVFTVSDIPGRVNTGLIYADWPLMLAEGETTCYIGDVLAGVVAESEEIARMAVARIHVEYEVFEPVTDVFRALDPDSPQVHSDHGNLLDNCVIHRGDATKILIASAYTVTGTYETQRIEHAFLEPEAALALPYGEDGLLLYSSGQGVYEDRRQVAMILGIDEEMVVVKQVSTGGGFGGKEDITVQGHVSLFAWLLKRPVRLALSREESIIMHPKRHPVWMDISLGCDANGMLTAVKLRAVGDSGAYASVGTKVMERVAGHAAGGYYIPTVDIESKTVYTNNIPSGAMRGFGANQVAFALESCIDELCRMGNFDRWQFRYNNALVDGLSTATGQKLKGTGIRPCLLALKDHYQNAKFCGLATGIKNSGIGNGMTDFCDVIIEIRNPEEVTIHHGWTEMGQGVHTIAIQTFCTETGLNPAGIKVVVDTSMGIKTGMTTSSRATALVGNAIIDAARHIREDIENHGIAGISGKRYKGSFVCDWTTKPGADVPEVVTHYSYGYAAQLVVLDYSGKIKTVYAAHDAGKIMNKQLFEGQIEGAVHMGIGYALSEELPMKDGHLVSKKLRDCGVLRAHETPDIVVIGVEVADEVGPYGAKGVGEIGLVPTAAAVANALCNYDGIRRTRLPMKI
jgi:selenium-dependent xanthine dehydrogenase